MRKGLLIAGIAVLAIGLITIPAVWLQSTAVSIPQYPSAAVLSPNIIGSASATVSWSGASDGTQVKMFVCGDSACNSVGTNAIGSGQGASGQFSVTVSGGTAYELVETGSASGVSASAQIHGFTPLLLIGIIMAVLGAIIAVLGFVLKPKVARAPKPRRSAQPEQAPPPEGETIWGAESRPTPDQPEMIRAPGETYTPPPSPYNLPASAMEPAASQDDLAYAESRAYVTTGSPPPDAAAAGGRAFIKCASCGMMNEPWLTNCRRCRRTLTSTGGV